MSKLASAAGATPPNGFWAQAAADPGRTVLITADGDEWTAGRLHASANQLVHGLRAAGLARGDAFAVVLPNSVEFFVAYLAASQAGFYLVPVNHHLVGPEIAWIVSDSGAKVLIAHERFADAARHAADEAKLPATHRYAVGPLAGFRPYAELLDGQPESAPEDRTLGWVMNYTSGTTGRPAASGARCPASSPRRRTSAASSGSSASSRTTTTCTSSAHRSTTPQCSSSRARPCTSATGWC